ncbi:GNAT family N-acetyltransferase [Clostridium polynesiense]|uniref:GNAT family N-acetyltransferase n=1 Tax=Clostridium polynesiense TaxID=1325933 RepID=UPI00058FA061|nr:GNAT family protein [Clostridium polynesiense]
MNERNNLHIEAVKGTSNEYIIKDSALINAGRFIIFDMNNENKRCSLRINFYKKDDQELMERSLKAIISTIFKKEQLHKINIYTGESNDIIPFINCGMELQGILEDNVFSKGKYENELIFGMDIEKYKALSIHSPSIINSSDIVLKILGPQNAEELLNYYIRNKNHLKEFEPRRDKDFYTLETQKRLLSDSYRHFLNGTGFDFGIFINDILIGKIKLSNIVYGVFKSGILGYSIDGKYQGRGYMKRAVQLICSYAFEELELHRVEASTLVDNIKSQRVLKSSGFEELGLNKNYLYINGRWQDHITFYRCQARDK